MNYYNKCQTKSLPNNKKEALTVTLGSPLPLRILSIRDFHGSKPDFGDEIGSTLPRFFSTSSEKRRCQSTMASSKSSSRCRKKNLPCAPMGHGICPLLQSWELLEPSSTMIGPTASPIWKAASCISGIGSARLSSILPAFGTRTCNEKRRDYECCHLF